MVVWLTVAGTGAQGQESSWLQITDIASSEDVSETENLELWSEDSLHRPVSFQEQPYTLVPRIQPIETPPPSAALEITESLFGGGLLSQTLSSAERRARAIGVGSDVVMGFEAVPRNTTDAGNLLGKSSSQVGLGVQRRNPIITDPRVRGSRVGRLAGSGSYWVPARLDLDTTLSKIDSRIVSNVVVIKGPYAARYGPDFSHLDFQMIDTPRYDEGFQARGATSFDYGSNGQHWGGRQAVWGGAENWGFVAGYGHRTGNDYSTGEQAGVPSSYNSGDVDFALGRDVSSDSRVEFRFLRLDQTGVELPGQAFDIDVLGTTGYEVDYTLEGQPEFDRLSLGVWYNRTRFHGSAQRPGKQQILPIFAELDLVGFTDVDAISTGFRLATSWGDPDSGQLTTGADLRYLQQDVNEITSGGILRRQWKNANSPIPQSESVNPGLFLEYTGAITPEARITAGGRVDFAAINLIDDPAKMSSLGTASIPARPISIADILGTNHFDRDFLLGALYVTGQYDVTAGWTAEVAAGYAERPPCLTEMYAAQTFMFVLQNGVNTVTGDPRLQRERLCQLDVGLKYDHGPLRGRIGAFHAWAWDYITFENMDLLRSQVDQQVVQEQLKYVNTALATFVGGEAWGEYDLTPWLTPFAALSYVDGRDRTRNGEFATKQASPGSPSVQVPGLPRGDFSKIAGADQEPLPGILPLESRVGLRTHAADNASRWGAELMARLVHGQNRVATSLLEIPTPGFTTWDLRGYWRPRERLLLIAGVENFTNRTYREHLNFISQNQLVQVFQPGANFYTGCEVSY